MRIFAGVRPDWRPIIKNFPCRCGVGRAASFSLTLGILKAVYQSILSLRFKAKRDCPLVGHIKFRASVLCLGLEWNRRAFIFYNGSELILAWRIEDNRNGKEMVFVVEFATTNHRSNRAKVNRNPVCQKGDSSRARGGRWQWQLSATARASQVKELAAYQHPSDVSLETLRLHF